MASASVFSANVTSVTVADVEAALTVISALSAQNMCNTVFRDMLTGFKVLVGTLERKEAETETAFVVFVKWLRLYLKIQATPTSNKVRKQFEKSVTPAVTYVIGSLQHKPKNMPNYHYELLSLTEELLQNCTPTTVEKMVNFETGLIACLWLPINFVGDFNTQMVALRLLVMLLKCADNARQESELEKIRCPQLSKMKEKLGAAVVVANYHAGKFENTAREILNNYNMNVARDVLVYSFRCKTLHLGDKFEFFKILNNEHFWIDLNYCPRTLTFNGRYKDKNSARYDNVSVGFNVKKLQLQQNTLHVQFGPPAKFSKQLSNAKELLGIACARLELPTEEATRLQENDFIFEYYNKVELPAQTNNTVQPSATCLANGQEDDNNESTDTSALQLEPPQSEEIVPEAAPVDVASPSKRLKNIFQRSYGFLLGSSGENANSSGERNTQTIESADVQLTQIKDINQLQERDIFKRPSLPKYERALHKTKHAATAKKKLPPKKTMKFSKAELAQALIDASPKPTQSSDVAEQAPDSKQQPTKQINKVKPMSFLSQPNECNTSEVAQPNLSSISIVDITTFLDNGHESAVVLNQNSGRSTLEDVPHISEDARPAASSLNTHETTAPEQQPRIDLYNVLNTREAAALQQPPRADVYDIMDESDAEPGQSYRNFRTRRRSVPLNALEKKIKVQARTRRGRPKKEANTQVNEESGTSAIAVTRNSRKSRKRTNTNPVSINDEPISPVVKLQRLNINGNNTVYSGNIEIDMTCTENQRSAPKSVVLSDNAGEQQQISITNKTPTSKNPEGYFQSSTFSATDQENEALSLQSRATTLSDANNSATAVAHKSIEVASYAPILDIENRCELNRNTITAKQQPTNFSVNGEQSTTKKRKAFIKRYFRGSTSSESELETDELNASQVSAAVTEADIEVCRQLEAPQNDSYDNLIIVSHRSNSSSPELPEPGIISIASNDEDDFNTTSQSECTLYRRHSGDSSNLGSDNDDHELPLQHGNENENAAVAVFTKTTTTTTTTTPPKIIAFKNIATTTITKRQVSTSITTMQQKCLFDSHENPVVPLNMGASTTIPAALEDLVLNDVTEQRHELALTSHVSQVSTTTKNNVLAKYSNDIVPAFSSRLLRRETSYLKQAFEQNLNVDFESSLKQAKKTCADIFLERVANVGERIFEEIEKQQQEQQEIEKCVEKIVSQLNWQCEAYQRNTERLQCFKQNTETLLQALTEINISAEIDKKFDGLVERLTESSNHLSGEQWRNFIQESAENMLKNLSNLSQL